ncbi:MAG: hypothetical protein HC769_08210 [Cyanobacteria bacterium CRU_2_1]|nr:hypothetical protein [Cyanobacteria bacterium RU_5_0]NJR58833.1 hypothetical protein [Cyanobacteria bacterium CRU_2_1]
MTSSTTDTISSIHYSTSTIVRAERAVRCTPFQLVLFVAMRHQSVDLRSIAGKMGVQNGYTLQPIAELAAENALHWLIQVGVLRREVDGQGITNSFRLTPLGHQLIERWQQQEDTLPTPTLSDRAYNAVSRWLRLPSWML